MFKLTKKHVAGSERTSSTAPVKGDAVYTVEGKPKRPSRNGHPRTNHVKHRAGEKSTEPLPFFAQVRVKDHGRIPAKAAKKIGVILGRSQSKSGVWRYSVFLGGLNESYSLPHAALLPTGKLLQRGEIYGGDKLRVVVDQRGSGTAVNT
jgi:hypothetical protein